MAVPPGFAYRSYDQLKLDLMRWIPHLPAVSGVAGIPRSGTIVAGILAELLHVELISIERLATDPPLPGYRPRSPRALTSSSLPILIVDDTCSSGQTIAQVREFVNARNVLWGAVYVKPEAAQLVDVYGYVNHTSNHSFAWNILQDCISSRLAIDMDGILCEDWPHRTEDGPMAQAYAEWLETVTPVFPVSGRVEAIITARLERHRPATEAWLKRHGIGYRRLLMHADCPPSARDHIGHKAMHIHNLRSRICAFVESCPHQARELAKRTGRPILCLPTGELHNGTPMAPAFSSASPQRQAV